MAVNVIKTSLAPSENLRKLIHIREKFDAQGAQYMREGNYLEAAKNYGRSVLTSLGIGIYGAGDVFTETAGDYVSIASKTLEKISNWSVDLIPGDEGAKVAKICDEIKTISDNVKNRLRDLF